jgi:ankyrin repeat protein
MSTIWQAAENNDCARLRELIGDGVDLDERASAYPDSLLTPLLFAAERGQADAVELLLEHGADVELKSEADFAEHDGWTALHFAAFRGATRCIEHLISAGANMDVPTSTDDIPLELILTSGRSKKTITSCVALLINAGARVTDRAGPNLPSSHIISAVRGNNREVVKMLLRGGAMIPHDDSLLIYFNPTNALVKRVQARGGWKSHAAKHKRVLVGLVTKCKPIPDDAAGLVVEFYCPVGGS